MPFQLSFFKQHLETSFSQKPPYHGLLDKLNCHLIFLFAANVCVSYGVKTVPLIVSVLPGQPRGDNKLSKTINKVLHLNHSQIIFHVK